MNKHITAFDLDLIIMAAMRWNISSRSGTPENTRRFLLANWYHPHIVRRHWLYLRDLNEDPVFWSRVYGIDLVSEWTPFRIELESMPELPPRRLNRTVRDNGAGILTVDALNYSLGRASYMPGVMMTFLRDNWQHPEIQQQQETILATIRQWLDHTKAEPIYVYVPEWQALYNKLQKQ
jgi:hypothetical protein